VLLASLRSPDLRVAIYPKAVRLECLRCIPGSTLVSDSGAHPNLVSIPLGNGLIAAWYAWVFLALAVAVQVFVYWIYPRKHRRLIFWAVIILVGLGPAIGSQFQGNSEPLEERLFIHFAANQAAWWAAGLGALVLGQVWCERRFAQLEQ
jgi:hypothetical protein